MRLIATVGVLLLSLWAGRAWAGTTEDYDVLIAGGRIVDGTGNAWFYGDVGIRGDTIVAVAARGTLHGFARQRIDASGLIVSPGFIDLLSSSDRAFLLGDGRSVSKLTQGITTEILGEGWNDAPLSELSLKGIEQLGMADAHERTVLRRFLGPDGFGKWLEAMQAHGISPNVGSFVGGMTLRMYAMGLAMRPPIHEELNVMQEVLKRALCQGAFGLGTALIYPPGSYASRDELVSVAQVMAPSGGLYISHIRSEGDQLLESLDEAIAIGREAGVPVEIYHLKAAGRRNWPKMQPAIDRINAARAAGEDVQANMYPYEAGGTTLSACLPPWVVADGRLLMNLSDSAVRARIRDELQHGSKNFENVCELATPDGVVVYGLKHPSAQAQNGKTLAQIAQQSQKNWPDALMDILLAEGGQTNAMFFITSEENLRLVLEQPWIKFVTDSSGEAPDGDSGNLAHPRAYGTFPRILGHYVRETHLLPLEDTIRKMSSAVAERIHLPHRGLLQAGYYADVVVFDPERIIDRATYEHPQTLSTGVRYVLVNGQLVVRDGTHTGAKPGRALHRAGSCVR